MQPPAQGFHPTSSPDPNGVTTCRVERALGFGSSHETPMPGFVAHPLPVAGRKRQFKLKLRGVFFQPSKSLGARKERIIVRLGVIPITDIEHPTRLMLGEPRGRQPFDAVSRPVLRFSFFKLLSLKLWIAVGPNHMKRDTLGLRRVPHILERRHGLRPSQMRQFFISGLSDKPQ